MNFGGYDAFDDPYAYPGTCVLKNLLGIQDAKQLEAFEVEISTLRSEEPLPEGRFDPAHYCLIHHHLFQDVYAWAGKYRTVRTSKGGNPFCYPEHIQDQMLQLFGNLQNVQISHNQNAEEFVLGVAAFLGELNAIHPFREGNGRAQLAFIGMLGSFFGHPLHLENIERVTFLPAMIASYSGHLEPLTRELRALLA